MVHDDAEICTLPQPGKIGHSTLKAITKVELGVVMDFAVEDAAGLLGQVIVPIEEWSGAQDSFHPFVYWEFVELMWHVIEDVAIGTRPTSNILRCTVRPESQHPISNDIIGDSVGKER